MGVSFIFFRNVAIFAKSWKNKTGYKEQLNCS